MRDTQERRKRKKKKIYGSDNSAYGEFGYVKLTSWNDMLCLWYDTWDVNMTQKKRKNRSKIKISFVPDIIYIFYKCSTCARCARYTQTMHRSYSICIPVLGAGETCRLRVKMSSPTRCQMVATGNFRFYHFFLPSTRPIDNFIIVYALFVFVYRFVSPPWMQWKWHYQEPSAEKVVTFVHTIRLNRQNDTSID